MEKTKKIRKPSVLTRFFHENKFGKALSIILNISFPVILVTLIEFFSFADLKKFIKFALINRPALYLFDILIVSLIIYSIFLVTSRMWIATTVTGSVLTLMAMISKFKFILNGDPFFPWDILLIRNAGDIAGMAGKGLVFEKYMVICVGIIIALMIIMFFAGWKIKVKPVYAIAPVAVFASLITFFSVPSISKPFMEKCLHMGSIDMLEQSKNYYLYNGFIGGFSLNLAYSAKPKPENYSSETINKILEKYSNNETAEVSDLERPNIIVIMSEAFYDVTKLENIKFSKDPTKNFRKLKQESISGELAVPTFSGGTVRSEFEFLTSLDVDALLPGSLPYQQYLNKKTPSIAWNLKDLGYKTIGMHSYLENFYSRKITYPFIGFDEFYAIEQMEKDYETIEKKGGYASDDFFIDTVIDKIEQNKDKPLFLYGITMENHGMYSNKYDEKDIKVNVEIEGADEDIVEMMTNYSTGVYDADQSLAKLVDYLRNSERETILLFFGDHKPTGLSDYKVYRKTNLIGPSEVSPSEFEQLYKTDYLIWSNKGKIKPETKYLATTSLAPELFSAAGFPQTAFYKFIKDFNNTLITESPYFVVAADKSVLNISKINKQQKDLIDTHKLLTYDALTGKCYFDKKFKR